jgi:hypothetical protein
MLRLFDTAASMCRFRADMSTTASGAILYYVEHIELVILRADRSGGSPFGDIGEAIWCVLATPFPQRDSTNKMATVACADAKSN